MTKKPQLTWKKKVWKVAKNTLKINVENQTINKI